MPCGTCTHIRSSDDRSTRAPVFVLVSTRADIAKGSAPILFFANKSDLPKAYLPENISQALELNKLTDRPWNIMYARRGGARARRIAPSIMQASDQPAQCNLAFVCQREPIQMCAREHGSSDSYLLHCDGTTSSFA
jgi:hypothetical protein